jgi:LacI family transcriptional regulator
MTPTKRSPSATLGDVARAAKVSVSAAGFALRNLPGVSEKTRQRIRKIADHLGYFPDARLTATMAGIRQASIKDLLPVIWFNTNREKDAWSRYSFLTPYIEGARERFKELGYRVEQIWTHEPGFSMRRAAQIIETRGIEGIIVTDPARHLRLNWKRVAGVAMGGSLLAPSLHRVAMDSAHNHSLALTSLRHAGYRRVGVCLTEQADRFSRHAARSSTLYFNSTIPRAHRVEPLFTSAFTNVADAIERFHTWLKTERPDAIVGHSSQLVGWVQEAGLRVPDDIGVAHTAIEDDVPDWAGIHANKREIGRLTASKLVSLILQRQFGIPTIASSELIPGVWRDGRTIRSQN